MAVRQIEIHYIYIYVESICGLLMLWNVWGRRIPIWLEVKAKVTNRTIDDEKVQQGLARLQVKRARGQQFVVEESTIYSITMIRI